MREGLPRARRVRLGGEIRGLLRTGSKRSGPLLEVFSSPSRKGSPRFGAIVPRHRHSIVERNRLRRRLKEVGRRDILPALRDEDCTVDVLVRARPAAYDAPFATLREALLRLTDRLCSERS